MKQSTLMLCLSLISLSANGQCDCEKIKRGDGAVIVQCRSLPVAYNNTTQVGLALASNGIDKFIALTVRFKNRSKRITSSLSIRFVNNELHTMELVNSDKAYIGNSEVANAIYLLEESQIEAIKNSPVKTISFKVNDQLMRTYEGKNRTDILQKQIKCI